MDFEERMLRKVIHYESSHTEGDYTMKGLKQKYEVYSGSISWTLETYLIPKVRLAILRTNNDFIHVFSFTGPKLTAALLYEAAKKLFPDLDKYVNAKLRDEMEAYTRYQSLYQKPFFTYTFPALIEWLDGSYKKELETMLKAKYKRKPENVKKVTNLIDEMVSHELKKLPS